MDRQPENLISVIISVYNVAPYLARCMDSVLQNTYRNLEVICVNDGSTDESPEILRSYAAAGNRIQYTIIEDAVPGYIPAITGDKDTGFTIVNTLTSVPTPARTTGDDSHMGLNGLIMLLGILAMAGFAVYVRKKSSDP